MDGRLLNRNDNLLPHSSTIYLPAPTVFRAVSHSLDSYPFPSIQYFMCLIQRPSHKYPLQYLDIKHLDIHTSIMEVYIFVILSDVDECSNQRRCSQQATCTNTPGSFTCRCNEGYVGNGYFCGGEFLRIRCTTLTLATLQVSYCTCFEHVRCELWYYTLRKVHSSITQKAGFVGISRAATGCSA